jgi:16S rRNA (guanine1516-N2)-methyltransferase
VTAPGASSCELASRGFALERIDGVLSLRDLVDPTLQPLSVDFSSPRLLHRLKTSGKNQPLAKAVGLGDACPFVLDATAGLGTDALVLASLGCRVRSIERSETIFALLQDGHKRLEQLEPELAARMSFEHADARAILASLTRAGGAPNVSEGIAPDVVYLDPMYPEEGRSKSALPKKTMQMFRRLLDGDEDADELWEAAMKAALKRVVVKRPSHAPSLGSRKPNHSFEGKTARFDLYLVSSF